MRKLKKPKIHFTLYLGNSQMETLKKIADEKDCSIAKLIRDAVEEKYGNG